MTKSNKTGLCLYLLSFGFALYSIAVLKILGFLAIPPAIFILLLLGGIPLGGLFTLKFLKYNEDSLVTLLWVSLAIITLTSLLGTYPSKLIYGQFSVYEFFINLKSAINKGFFLILLGALAFFPFFIIYGAAEFLGYQIGLMQLSNKIVYALYLLGTMTAFLFFRQVIGMLGLCQMMLIAAITFCVIMLLVKRRGVLKCYATLTFFIGLLFIPHIENLYLRILTFPESYSLLFDKKENYKVLHSGWSRYSQFTLVDNVRTGDIYGVLNGVNLWGVPYGHFEALTLDYAPFKLIDENASIAIIGPGGGRQIPLALATKPKEIVAIELIPDVIDVLKNKFPEKNLYAYTDPRVTTVTMDGKKYFEQTDKKFDLILIPHTEGGAVFARTIFEPSETLYTIETLKSYVDHLNEGGILAINKHQSVNLRGVLFKQYMVGMQTAGLITYGYRKNDFVIIGHKNLANKKLPANYVQKLEESGFTYFDTIDETITVATDNNPFRLGAFVEYFGSNLFRQVFAGLSSIFILLVAVTVVFFNRHIHKINAYTSNFLPLCVQAIFVGINFILLENYLIFLLYRYLDNPLDAIYTGSIVFLFFAAIGSCVIKKPFSLIHCILAFAGLSLIYIFGSFLPAIAVIVLLIPLIVYTGTFFPSLFFGHRKRLILIFTMDTLGTILGGMLSTLVPIFWGFSQYFQLSLICFALCYLILLRNTADLLPQEQGIVSGESEPALIRESAQRVSA
jgi:spermidine synthase